MSKKGTGSAAEFYTFSLVLALAFTAFAGCASSGDEKADDDGFFTSGSAQADMRARKIVAEEKKNGDSPPLAEAAVAPEQTTLYERLGGEEGVRAIVDDFIKRALEDPRVNWSRQGVTVGGWFRRDKSVEWNPTPENVRRLKEHFVQFISLATGGPVQYDGQPIRTSHENLQITRPEFDATVGDLKATLDSLAVKPEIQKELLSIIESTRPQIVLER